MTKDPVMMSWLEYWNPKVSGVEACEMDKASKNYFSHSSRCYYLMSRRAKKSVGTVISEPSSKVVSGVILFTELKKVSEEDV